MTCKSCGYPITKSSNQTPVIGHPCDRTLHDKWACREPITIKNFVIDTIIIMIIIITTTAITIITITIIIIIVIIK